MRDGLSTSAQAPSAGVERDTLRYLRSTSRECATRPAADVDAELARHRLRNEYPRARYGNQPRGPAVAASTEDSNVDADRRAQILETPTEAANGRPALLTSEGAHKPGP
jgi:hypothetical protein